MERGSGSRVLVRQHPSHLRSIPDANRLLGPAPRSRDAAVRERVCGPSTPAQISPREGVRSLRNSQLSQFSIDIDRV
jgi:hypothetical protein